MKKTMMKKLISGGVAAALSIGIMLPSSVSAATPNDNPQSWEQQIRQLLESQGWKGDFTWEIQQPSSNPQNGTTVTKPAPKPAAPTASKPSATTSTTVSSNKATFATQVIMLVNKERAKQGLSALKVNKPLNTVAVDKAKDMSRNQYFSHTSPTYGSPFDMMKKYGISYRYAGENIAKGQRTPEEVMKAWMNSDGHRKNIMSPNFTMIGVGYYNGHWVQMFISQ